MENPLACIAALEEGFLVTFAEPVPEGPTQDVPGRPPVECFQGRWVSCRSLKEVGATLERAVRGLRRRRELEGAGVRVWSKAENLGARTVAEVEAIEGGFVVEIREIAERKGRKRVAVAEEATATHACIERRLLCRKMEDVVEKVRLGAAAYRRARELERDGIRVWPEARDLKRDLFRMGS